MALLATAMSVIAQIQVDVSLVQVCSYDEFSNVKGAEAEHSVFTDPSPWKKIKKRIKSRESEEIILSVEIILFVS